MNYKGLVYLFVLSPLLLFGFAADAQKSSSVPSITKACITVWRMMSDLVENTAGVVDTQEIDDYLDALLCAVVRLRDKIQLYAEQPVVDATVSWVYVANSIDCIESYAYDLTVRYPGPFSGSIKKQVERLQEQCGLFHN